MWATGVALVLYLAACLFADVLANEHLKSAIDSRLSSRLTETAQTVRSGEPLTAEGGFTSSTSGDFDDAPVVIWWIPNGAHHAVALESNAPNLPKAEFAATGPVDVTIGGHGFRLAGETIRGHGRIVAGTSTSSTRSAISTLLAIEGGLAPIALGSLYVAAWLIGRRAATPIERARRAQLDFTADASHELRTPLSVIETEVGLALAVPRDEIAYREALERVSDESKRLRAIVEDLLWLSRFESLPEEPAHDAVDLSVVATACARRFGPSAQVRSISLRSVETETPMLVLAPAEWLDRLTSVLIDNAVRYADVGGSIVVSTARTGTTVSLSVEDSGPGITPGERALIFQRFHRASTVPGGAGLGLSIADAIVRGTGGAWEISTSSLGGARITVNWSGSGRVGKTFETRSHRT
jgi:signal transduction histidine kinase